MKNPVYLTEEGRKELELIIKELENKWKNCKPYPMYDDYVDKLAEQSNLWGKITIYKEILSNNIILPIEEDWDNVGATKEQKLSKHYPNGVIIKQ